jgi:hypothetical protein
MICDIFMLNGCSQVDEGMLRDLANQMTCGRDVALHEWNQSKKLMV